MRIYQNMNATSSRLALLAVLLILKMRKTVFCAGPNGHFYPEKKMGEIVHKFPRIMGTTH